MDGGALGGALEPKADGETEAARRSRLKVHYAAKATREKELKLERARQFAAGELAIEDLRYQELQEQCKLHGVPGKTLAARTAPELISLLRGAMGEAQPEVAPAAPLVVEDVGLCAACDNDGLFATAEFWREEAERKHPGNAHLRDLFQAAWLPQLLGAPGSGRLWRGRRRALFKELTEAYAVLLRVQAAAASAGCDADGRGVVVFDCCSGKGLATLLMSVALPAATLVGLDKMDAGQMDLSHLRGRENVRFHALDIFLDDFGSLLAREARGAQMACMVGTHLCGALSPRLLEVGLLGLLGL